MGYTVLYGSAKDQSRRRKIRLALPIAAIAVILSGLLAGHIWQEEAHRLRLALFPWERESVQQAFSGFQQDLKEGGSIGDAITAFCAELLAESEFSK